MKTAILEYIKNNNNNNNNEKLKIRDIKKVIIKEYNTEEDDKFDKILQKLEKKKKIEIIDEKYIKIIKHHNNKEDKEIKDKEDKIIQDKGNKKRKNDINMNDNNNDNNNNNNNNTQELKIHKKNDINNTNINKIKKVEAKDRHELWKNGESAWKNNTLDFEYLAQNPDKITRLFCGNLQRSITEEQLKEHLPGIVYIKWIRDKETGEFYGTTFLEMADSKSAAAAVLKDRTKYLGRELKIYYCPPKPGDIWPPIGGITSKPNALGTSNNNNGSLINKREKQPKPPNCCKLFMGNLSYNIDDDTIVEFFKDCGGEVVGLRWLTHKDSGDFKGCGYVEFDHTEAADNAFLLDGAMLLGRPIRIDWG